MSVGEAHTLGGELIHVGSGYAGIRIVAPDIAVPHVISEDKNDIRLSHELFLMYLLFRYLNPWGPSVSPLFSISFHMRARISSIIDS